MAPGFVGTRVDPGFDGEPLRTIPGCYPFVWNHGGEVVADVAKSCGLAGRGAIGMGGGNEGDVAAWKQIELMAAIICEVPIEVIESHCVFIRFVFHIKRSDGG